MQSNAVIIISSFGLLTPWSSPHSFSLLVIASPYLCKRRGRVWTPFSFQRRLSSILYCCTTPQMTTAWWLWWHLHQPPLPAPPCQTPLNVSYLLLGGLNYICWSLAGWGSAPAARSRGWWEEGGRPWGSGPHWTASDWPTQDVPHSSTTVGPKVKMAR